MRLARSRQVTKPRRPESVLVIVYTDDGNILLLQRSSPFEFWQSVTGSLEPGESSADAAYRELFEETGFATEGTLTDTNRSRVFTIDPRWRSRYAPDVHENIEYEWRYRLASAAAVRIEELEHAAFRWTPIDAAIDAVWSWTNKEALSALKTELRQKSHSV